MSCNSPEQSSRQQHGCVMYSVTYPPLDSAFPEPPSSSQQTAQRFSLSPENRTPDPVRVSIPANPEFTEPKDGLLPEDFDGEKLLKAASAAQFKDYKPSIFSKAPLPPLESIPTSARLMTINGFSKINPSSIVFIRLEGCYGEGASPKTTKSLGKMLSLCVNAEIVILRKLGIDKLQDFVFPKLRHCDMAQNAVKSISDCERFVSKSPSLEVLNMVENPVCDKPDFFSRVIGLLPHLEVLNEKEISMEVRFRCIVALGGEGGDESRDIGMLRWDLAVCNVPQVREMYHSSAWRPDLITRLILRDQSLIAFHVGTLTNLTMLDLHGNAIPELRGCGLERLKSLEMLDLSNNQIRHKESLSVLAFTISLKRLMLTGNPMEVKDYTNWAIYETRHLCGSNHALGLVELDGKPVTVAQRVEARKVCSLSDPDFDFDRYRWMHAMISAVGHAQIRNVQYMKTLRTLALPGMGLTVVNLSAVPMLEVLDLARNCLPKIAGLDGLMRLRVLDLTDNPKLKLSSVLGSLSVHTNLQSVAFAVNVEGHKRHPSKKTYRKRVLEALLFKNPTLVLVDGTVVSIPERCAALASTGADVSEVETYRFNLAVTVSCTTHLRSYNPDAVGLGAQYNAAKVTSLRCMNDAGLSSRYCNLAPFERLEELDLSRNQLTDVLVMGLQLMKRLKAVDLSDNLIETPLPQIAELIDSLPSLTAIALRGNPVMKTAEDRARLLSLLKSIGSLASPLKVVDTDITVDERCAAMVASGKQEKDVDALRCGVALMHRAPADKKQWATLQMLDLRKCGITRCNCAEFPALRVLLLRGNAIASMEAIPGLQQLRGLVVLDLRDNRLTQLESVAAAVVQLPQLQSLGIAGNRFNGSSAVRERLLRMIPGLWNAMRYPLGNVDGEEITIQEVCNAASVADQERAVLPTKELFRFRVAIFRKAHSAMPLDHITELKLDGCGLSTIVFNDMAHLVRLSLSGNEIHGSDFFASGIDKLTELRALDISNNKIKDKDNIKKIVCKLTALEALWIVPNPCFPQDTPEYRHKVLAFFKGSHLRLLDGRPTNP